MKATDVPLHIFWSKLCQKVSNTQQDATLKQMTMQDLIDLIGNGMCAYTNKEFQSLQDITFERVNPKVGYVPGNVLLVNRESNQHKACLDAFIHRTSIDDAMKIKLMRKAIYQLEKANGTRT